MNKVIAAVLTALLTVSPAIAIAGDYEGSTTLDVSYSATAENTVTVSGVAENVPGNAIITITIMHSDKTIGDIPSDGTSALGILAAAEKTAIGADGAWSFDWQPAKSGDYDIYISSKYFASPVMDKFFVSANRSSVIETVIGGDETELEALFEDKENLKAVIIDSTLYENIEDTSAIGKILNSIRDDFETEEEILSSLTLCCYLAELGESPASALMDSVVSQVQNMGYAFENAALYEKSSDDIKTGTAVKLSENVDISLKDMNRLFTEALILSGVEKSTSYVSVVDYLDLLENEDYEDNKTAVAKAVVGKSYTMASLLDAIEEAADENSNKTSGSSGGGGGRGGRGGSVSVGGSVAADTAVSGTNETETQEPVKKELLTFSDVPGTHWAFDAINNLRWKDIVSGNEKGEFLPDNNVTRAEVIKMLCELYGAEPVSKTVFDDVSESHWCYKYIAAAYDKKFILGDGSSFKPDEYITRQDLATIIFRVSGHYGVEYTENEKDFADKGIIDEYAKEAVGKLAGKGILQGKGNGCFEPKSLSTRAETAAVIYRLFKLAEGGQV